MEIVERMLRNDTPTQEEMAAVFLAMLKRHVNVPTGLAERFAKCCVQVFFYANWDEVNRDLMNFPEMIFMTTTVVNRMSVTQSMSNILRFIQSRFTSSQLA